MGGMKWIYTEYFVVLYNVSASSTMSPLMPTFFFSREKESKTRLLRRAVLFRF
jgi:hypothetical protein